MYLFFLLGTLDILLGIGHASKTFDSQIIINSSLFFNLTPVLLAPCILLLYFFTGTASMHHCNILYVLIPDLASARNVDGGCRTMLLFFSLS